MLQPDDNPEQLDEAIAKENTLSQMVTREKCLRVSMLYIL
jgi:hypothetical protein